MPELPPSADEQISQLYQELSLVGKAVRNLGDRIELLANLMHEQDDHQLEQIKALEGQSTTLQAAVAQLQGQPPVAGQNTATEAADLSRLQASLFDAIAGEAQVQRSVDGRQPQP